MRVIAGGNSVGNDAARFNAVQRFQTVCNFVGNGDRDDAVVKSVALDTSRARFDFAFGEVVYRVQRRHALEQEQRGQSVTKHVQVAMDNFGTESPESAMQPVIGAAVKSRAFSEVLDGHAGIVQLCLQIAADAAPNRDDPRVKAVTVEALYDMDGDAFGATGAEHGNDVHDFYFFHNLDWDADGCLAVIKFCSKPGGRSV